MLDLKADAKLADLGRVLPNAKGAVSVAATVTGDAADPAAKLQIGSERLTFEPIHPRAVSGGGRCHQSVTATEGLDRCQGAGECASNLDPRQGRA